MKILRTSNGAPVCPISRDQAVSGMAPRIIKTIPRAVDLQSAIVAANEAALLAAFFYGPGTVTNNVFPPFMPKPGGSSPQQDGGGGGIPFSRWREVKRKVNQYKLANRHNPENWVKIQRIVMIEWEDRKNGQKIKFEWGQSPGIPTTKETLLHEKNLVD